MKDILKFINEKLRLDKNLKNTPKDPSDPNTWAVGDIIVFFGFHAEFFKIIKRTAKKFDLQELGTKLVSGYYNSSTYQAIPAKLDNENTNIFKNCGMSKHGYFIIDGNKGYAEKWDGKAVEAHGNL